MELRKDVVEVYCRLWLPGQEVAGTTVDYAQWTFGPRYLYSMKKFTISVEPYHNALRRDYGGWVKGNNRPNRKHAVVFGV